MIFDRTYGYKSILLQAFGLRLIAVTLPDGDIAVRLNVARNSSPYAWADAVRGNLLRQWCERATDQQLDRAHKEAVHVILQHGKNSLIGCYFTPVMEATGAALHARSPAWEAAMFSPSL